MSSANFGLIKFSPVEDDLDFMVSVSWAGIFLHIYVSFSLV